jgi:hypothetical protein
MDTIHGRNSDLLTNKSDGLNYTVIELPQSVQKYLFLFPLPVIAETAFCKQATLL